MVETKEQVENRMLHRLLLILLIVFSPLAKAESTLPDCLADQSLRFHNYFGTYIAGGQK